ncbi:DUF4145 domain-containing protein [Curtobacterium citreum]|uniref:DUF4145 domain-containing protein n=1 Tax=Curtobacterium citreum TaxID=2036 RepID=A0ABU8YC08_9MICO
MASTLCPYCKKNSHMTPKWGRLLAGAAMAHMACTCDECHRIVIGEAFGQKLGVNAPTENFSYLSDALERAEEITWLPLAAEAPEVHDVPDSIARAAKEAYSSASVGNFMAAILMARTVIEASAKDRGITSGNLKSKIDAMKDADLIRPAMAEQAHEVRFAGNDMAHGDIDVAPDAIDAEEILALMGSVLLEVFQDPARLERIRAKRVAQSS